MAEQCKCCTVGMIGAEPVAWLHSDNGIGIPAITRSRNVADSWFSKGWNIKPLYTTPPAWVVPQDVLDALQKVARIRLDLNEFDGDRRGIADCLGNAEEALIEVVNRRAAMLQAGNSTVTPDGWIPVSERMPESIPQKHWSDDVIAISESGDVFRMAWCPSQNCWSINFQHIVSASPKIIGWMPLPAAPQQEDL